MVVKCLSMLLHLARLFPATRVAEIVGTWEGNAVPRKWRGREGEGGHSLLLRVPN